MRDGGPDPFIHAPRAPGATRSAAKRKDLLGGLIHEYEHAA